MRMVEIGQALRAFQSSVHRWHQEEEIPYDIAIDFEIPAEDIVEVEDDELRVAVEPLPDDRDWTHEIEAAFSGTGDWFTSHLLRLLVNSDPENTERIRLGFPAHVAAWERWKYNQGEFARTTVPVDDERSG